jgi:hypothetical protein
MQPLCGGFSVQNRAIYLLVHSLILGNIFLGYGGGGVGHEYSLVFNRFIASAYDKADTLSRSFQ